MNIFPENSEKVIIVRAPGTNCDSETINALKTAGFQTASFTINDLVYSDDLLKETIGIVFPGGFTYGDYLGSGAVFSFLVKIKLLNKIFDFLNSGGRILGICNGFQILVRLGLLPFPDEGITASLETNITGRFECRWISLIKEESQIQRFESLPDKFDFPIAHMEGRLILKNNDVYERIIENKQAVFYYGISEPTEKYPLNPNGSAGGLAGISDPSGSILGMMPHPERYIYHDQYFKQYKISELTTGIKLFRNFFKSRRT